MYFWFVCTGEVFLLTEGLLASPEGFRWLELISYLVLYVISVWLVASTLVTLNTTNDLATWHI